MSLQPTFSLLKDATASQTGGSALSLTYIGDTPDGYLRFANLAATDFRLREEMRVKAKPFKAELSAPGGYAPQRNTAVMHLPILLANGVVHVNTLKCEFVTHPETSAAQKATQLAYLQSIVIDSDVIPAVRDGNVT